MQCDHIGRFFKVVGNKFYCKSSPNILKTDWAFCKAFKVKTMVSTFLTNFEEIRLLFIPPSGHTGLTCETDVEDGATTSIAQRTLYPYAHSINITFGNNSTKLTKIRACPSHRSMPEEPIRHCQLSC